MYCLINKQEQVFQVEDTGGDDKAGLSAGAVRTGMAVERGDEEV
jgi:hypothetical protein